MSMDDEYEEIEPPAKRGRRPVSLGGLHNGPSEPVALVSSPLERFAIVLGVRVDVPEGYVRLLGDQDTRVNDLVLDCAELPEVHWNRVTNLDVPQEASDFQMVVRPCRT